MTKSVRILLPNPVYIFFVDLHMYTLAACCCNTVAFQLSMLCMKYVSVRDPA